MSSKMALVFWVVSPFLLSINNAWSQAQTAKNVAQTEESSNEYIKNEIAKSPQADSVLESFSFDSVPAPGQPVPEAVPPLEDKEEDEEVPYDDHRPSWDQPEDLEYSARSKFQSIEVKGGMSTILGGENDFWKWGPNFGFNIIVPAYYVLHMGVGVNYVMWKLDNEAVRKDFEAETATQHSFILAEGKKNCLKIAPFFRLQSISEIRTNKFYLDLGGGLYYYQVQKEYSGSITPVSYTGVSIPVPKNVFSNKIGAGVLCGGGLSSRLSKYFAFVLGSELNYVFIKPDPVLYLLIKGGIQINLKMY